MFSAVGIKNQAVELGNQFEAQISDNKNIYTKVNNIIFGLANVAETERASFGEIYSDLMGSRAQGTENAMMAWVTEHTPQMSNDLYLQVSQAIEVQRNEFARAQTKMISIKQEHDNLRERFPSSIFMSMFGETELELQMVTSTQTERAFETGVDDNTNPFQN